MNENKKTYIIAGSILLLAYVVYRKRTYPTETNIVNLLFGGILYPMYPTPPPPPPSKPIEPPTEQQETLNNLKPISPIKPSTPIVTRPAGLKSYSPDVRPAPMPQIQSIRPSFGQYGGKKI